MIRSFIGLGSNLAGPRGQVERAIRALSSLGPLRVSSLYRTEPLGPPDQPWYVNAVAELRAPLAPEVLLDLLRRLEGEAGRVRPRERWGPRELDLDLLLAGAEVRAGPELSLPHPGLLARRFVLVPLCELDPDLCHPVTGERLADRLCVLADPLRVEWLAPPPTGSSGHTTCGDLAPRST